MSVPPPGFGKIPPQRLKFADRLAGLCAIELSLAEGDPDRLGEMVERLTSSLAFTIAIAARGNAEGMSEMIMGAESYLNEAAASHAELGGLIEAVKHPRPQAKE